MCKWNPDNAHPFRICKHGHRKHEVLHPPAFAVARGDPPQRAIWCNECWTLCAFNSDIPVRKGVSAVLADFVHSIEDGLVMEHYDEYEYESENEYGPEAGEEDSERGSIRTSGDSVDQKDFRGGDKLRTDSLNLSSEPKNMRGTATELHSKYMYSSTSSVGVASGNAVTGRLGSDVTVIAPFRSSSL